MTHMTLDDALARIAALEREVARLRWQPIETAPKDGTVILRPHCIWGAMDVRYLTDDQKRHRILDADIKWAWLNGDYTTAWTEEAFLPFWMPIPPSPVPASKLT